MSEATRTEGSQATRSVASEQQPTDPMERNRDRWRALAEAYLDVLESLEASLEGIRHARNLPGQALQEWLKVLEDRIAEVLRGDVWRTAYNKAVEEAWELSKRAKE